MLWDIFCKVIDNYGDIGVCWRLTRQLAARGHGVRLWVDDASALTWMAPRDALKGIQLLPWDAPSLPDLPHSDVLIEAFGCEIPPDRVAALCHERTHWINLEYLSAEPYVERSHGLPSPVLNGPLSALFGPSSNRVKRFFYPGFTPATGGLLREPDLLQRQQRFDRAAWLSALGIPIQPNHQQISLFCYEPVALPDFLNQLAQQPTQLFVTAGRATQAVQACAQAFEASSKLRIHYLPYLNQDDYDHLLWACDLNFVRGEDSLARALWAARPGQDASLQSIPFVWHIYPQHDDAHHAKLQAFLRWMQAPASLRAFHEVWNGLSSGALISIEIAEWCKAAQHAHERLLTQSDLLTQLETMVQEPLS